MQKATGEGIQQGALGEKGFGPLTLEQGRATRGRRHWRKPLNFEVDIQLEASTKSSFRGVTVMRETSAPQRAIGQRLSSRDGCTSTRLVWTDRNNPFNICAILWSA